jgi:dolichol kinase
MNQRSQLSTAYSNIGDSSSLSSSATTHHGHSYHKGRITNEVEEEAVGRMALIKAIAGLIVPHLGGITVGIGDAFGAIIGSQYGRMKWSTVTAAGAVGAGGAGTTITTTSRTVEGSVAVMASMCIASAVTVMLQLGQLEQGHLASLSPSAFGDVLGTTTTTTISSMEEDLSALLSTSTSLWTILIPALFLTLTLTTILEAFTTENDNLALPLFASVALIAILQLLV